ncbi:FCD domain-containing protein, partial [Enterocloster bolteae]|uniref:FCD domain-containing protein n=1 Tax=Enterocloster bolteae TaxID=208479 RepID=UPI00210B9317
RLYLELSSLPKVMENITKADIEELKRQNQVRLVNPEKKDLWIAWRNNYQFHMTVVRLAGNEQVNNAMEQAMTTYRRAYAQLYTLKKDVIAANKASYHDFFVSSLERHDVFSVHEYLKKDILFMEDELLGTGITT